MHSTVRKWRVVALFLVAIAFLAGIRGTDAADPAARAESILRSTGVQGGLVVHVGCGDGRLTAGLGAEEGYTVLGLDIDSEDVATARSYVASRGLYGRVSVDHWDGAHLPFIDNLVDLVVVEERADLSAEEIERVLSPQGVAYVKQGGGWTKRVKPWPKEIDEWTHYLHDASGNPVAQDDRVGPPRGLQWVGSPEWSRHHDHMSSISAMVSANGRLFTIVDRGSRKSILLPGEWYLVARDAFNGTVLWDRKIDSWRSQLIPRKCGPAQLPRRLVAVGDTVYATLGLEAPVSAIDAATGETIRTLDGTAGTTEMVVSGGTLFAVIDSSPPELKPDTVRDLMDIRRNRTEWWTEDPTRLVAVDTDSGEVQWERETPVLPLTLAAEDGNL